MDTVEEMYDLRHSMAGEYLSRFTYLWEALRGIKEMIRSLIGTLDRTQYTQIGEEVWYTIPLHWHPQLI